MTARTAPVSHHAQWRLAATVTIAPKASVTYAFRFQWARDFAGVRDVLYNQGKFDTSVVPGMVVPSDLAAMFALRTKNTTRTYQPPLRKPVVLGGCEATATPRRSSRRGRPRAEAGNHPVNRLMRVSETTRFLTQVRKDGVISNQDRAVLVKFAAWANVK